MKITAANGQVYDLEKLTDTDKRVLQTLGHLPKETAAVAEETPPAVKKAKKDESI